MILQVPKCKGKVNGKQYAWIIRNVSQMKSRKHLSAMVLTGFRPFVIKVIDCERTTEELSCGDELGEMFGNARNGIPHSGQM